jgi:hypothetical protein
MLSYSEWVSKKLFYCQRTAFAICKGKWIWSEYLYFIKRYKLQFINAVLLIERGIIGSLQSINVGR